MTRSTPRKPLSRPDSSAPEPGDIDARYGLEPVFEPGDGDTITESPTAARFHCVQCPYCGERFEALLDLSAGSARYVEDCQVCCQPIELGIEVDHTGALVALTAQRSA